MAERETPPQYEETRHPDNPPNNMLSRETRRAALGSYLGPVVALFLIVGLGWLYWSHRGPSEPDFDTAHVGVGTTGLDGPGAGDPTPPPNNARDELERRGGVKDPTQGPMPALRGETPITSLGDLGKDASFVSGRHVDVNNVEVDSVQGNSFWVRDGGDRVEVIAPAGASMPSKGAHVRVVGTVEGAGGDQPRIRATSVSPR